MTGSHRNADGDVLIEYAAVPNKAAGGGWLPVIWNNGHRHGSTWLPWGYDKSGALARAKEKADEEAARYIGHWNITVRKRKEASSQGREPWANPAVSTKRRQKLIAAYVREAVRALDGAPDYDVSAYYKAIAAGVGDGELDAAVDRARRHESGRKRTMRKHNPPTTPYWRASGMNGFGGRNYGARVGDVTMVVQQRHPGRHTKAWLWRAWAESPQGYVEKEGARPDREQAQRAAVRSAERLQAKTAKGPRSTTSRKRNPQAVKRMVYAYGGGDSERLPVGTPTYHVDHRGRVYTKPVEQTDPSEEVFLSAGSAKSAYAAWLRETSEPGWGEQYYERGNPKGKKAMRKRKNLWTWRLTKRNPDHPATKRIRTRLKGATVTGPHRRAGGGDYGEPGYTYYAVKLGNGYVVEAGSTAREAQRIADAYNAPNATYGSVRKAWKRLSSTPRINSGARTSVSRGYDGFNQRPYWSVHLNHHAVLQYPTEREAYQAAKRIKDATDPEKEVRRLRKDGENYRWNPAGTVVAAKLLAKIALRQGVKWQQSFAQMSKGQQKKELIRLSRRSEKMAMVGGPLGWGFSRSTRSLRESPDVIKAAMNILSDEKTMGLVAGVAHKKLYKQKPRSPMLALSAPRELSAAPTSAAEPVSAAEPAPPQRWWKRALKRRRAANPLRVHTTPHRTHVRIETTSTRLPSTTGAGAQILRRHGGWFRHESAHAAEASFDSVTAARRAALAARKAGYYVSAVQETGGGNVRDILKTRANPHKRRGARGRKRT